MIGLFLNELLRFWYRLSIRWLVAIVLAGLTLGSIVMFFGHSSDGPDTAAIQRQQEQARQECISSSIGLQLPPGETIQDYCAGGYDFFEDRRFCVMDMLVTSGCEIANGIRGGYGGDQVTARPTDFAALVDAEQFPPTDQLGRPIGAPVSRGYQDGYFTGLAGLTMMISVLIGSTFVGAEYRAGTVESALVVEPRRRRLLMARYLAGVVGMFVVTLGLLGFHLVTLLPTILGRSDSGAVLGGFWTALAWSVLRIALVSAAVGLVAMALTTIGKHTVAGVGGLLGYLIVGQIMVLVLVTTWRPIEFAQNVMAVVTHSDVVKVQTGGFTAELVAHGPTMALGYVAAYVVFVTAVASLVFLRRDVD